MTFLETANSKPNCKQWQHLFLHMILRGAHTERQAAAANTSQWWFFPSVNPSVKRHLWSLPLAARCVHALRSKNVNNANWFSYAVLPKSTNSVAPKMNKFFSYDRWFLMWNEHDIIILFSSNVNIFSKWLQWEHLGNGNNDK